MGILDSIKDLVGGPKPAGKVSLAIKKENAKNIKGFNHSKTWTCGCGANLKIRSRDPRAEGPSNFHPAIPAGDLNWNGLAVERGWQVDPKVICPACHRGQTVAEYRKAKVK